MSKNSNKTTTQCTLHGVRRSALKWWNGLDKSHKRVIEFKIYGEGEPWEDNALTVNDIIHMYRRYYA